MLARGFPASAQTIWGDAPDFDPSVHALLRADAPACAHHVYKSLLKACNRRKDLPFAQHIYAHLASHKLHLSLTLGNYLVVTLATCGAIHDARTIFDSLPQRTVHSWTAMISAYTECGHVSNALHLHRRMKEDGIQPDNFTFASLFKACGAVPSHHAGRELHADAEIRGLLADVVVGNSIVSMYGKCGFIADAEIVFCSLPERVAASWNAMVGAYMDQGHERKALQLFRQMCKDLVKPNQYTFASILVACTSALERDEDQNLDDFSAKHTIFKIGQALHGYASELGLVTQTFIVTSLLNFYGKCGTIEEAENVFVQFAHHDVVSWSAMLYAYVDQGQGIQALHLFREMQRRGAEPDQHTFVIAFQACGIVAEQEGGCLLEDQLVKVMSLEIARAVHDDATKKGFISDIFVGNILVNVYGKCGSIQDAEEAFVAMPMHDIVSSTAMLSALVELGQGHKAFRLYKQLQQDNERLNDINLICMLRGCAEAGSVEMCREVHFAAASAEWDLDIPMAATLMSAYGSCTSMMDAEAVLGGLRHPDIVPWSVCIEGHAGQAECLLGLRVFEELQLSGVCADEATFASVISSCSHGGFVVDGLQYFMSISTNCAVTLNSKHYGSVVDLLARAGAFERIEQLLESIPCSPDLNLWLCLLSACRAHGNVDLGKLAFEHAVSLQPKQSAAYTLMSNICCDATPAEYAQRD